MHLRLGVTAIIRDRTKYITEWIAFHYLVGFKKFFIFLDEGDVTQDVLNDLQKHFDIQILKTNSSWENKQLDAYQHSCEKFLNKVDWMAFIDSDEFLFPTHKETVGEVLEEFENKKVSAIGVYWSTFGSSGFIKDPPGLIIENYKKRAEENFEANRHIKSILKSGQSRVGPYSPHHFKTELGTFDENLRPVTYGWTNYNPTYNKLRINHYICQSREYFDTFKLNTRGPDGGDLHTEEWRSEHDRNEVGDDSMERFVKPLKNLLKDIK